jgi:hypothetical protein
VNERNVNVGYIIYSHGVEPGTLDVVWRHRLMGSGTGRAVGGVPNRYEGTYQITYCDEADNPVAQFDLEIEPHDGWVDLTWRSAGEVMSRGVGTETAVGLIAGFRRVAD